MIQNISKILLFGRLYIFYRGSIQVYRKARVCAKIIEESRYGEALVRVIKLMELPDEDDAQGELAFRLQNRKEDTSTDTAQIDSNYCQC